MLKGYMDRESLGTPILMDADFWTVKSDFEQGFFS